MTPKSKSKAPAAKKSSKPRSNAKPKAVTAPPSPEDTGAPGGKLGVMAAMLREPAGTTIKALMDATGWQAHSVRGALAGALKKKHGLTISSRKTEAGRIYSAQANA